jgi:hypothetical protein
MEDVAARKREELALKERLGVLTARYATMTSKSRVSRHCEQDFGLVEATMDDVVRVAIDSRELATPPVDERIQVEDVLGSELDGLSQVMRR